MTDKNDSHPNNLASCWCLSMPSRPDLILTALPAILKAHTFIYRLLGSMLKAENGTKKKQLS